MKLGNKKGEENRIARLEHKYHHHRKEENNNKCYYYSSSWISASQSLLSIWLGCINYDPVHRCNPLMLHFSSSNTSLRSLAKKGRLLSGQVCQLVRCSRPVIKTCNNGGINAHTDNCEEIRRERCEKDQRMSIKMLLHGLSIWRKVVVAISRCWNPDCFWIESNEWPIHSHLLTTAAADRIVFLSFHQRTSTAWSVSLISTRNMWNTWLLMPVA